ncbi:MULTISPECIES: hypothetical protein [unclassified Ruegeria]|uniref:hypothetical protein n=1 Tax=unclassified Ruegeria TaxID=2625375 RepID=UPI001ADADCE0|nr:MULTISPECIES: hypothetical protein [unclassified Ruegeria]MBO9412243.1 hypothetical protein [Ruegeria sp. R8_1]MBO9417451.1 hypothetical protein [Ruegeria sp. R8_2]
MIVRAIATLSLLATVGACASKGPSRDEIWSTIEGCDGNELCSFATLIAEEYGKLVGKSLGQGISVKSAETDGKIVDLAFYVPDRIKNVPTTGGRTPSEELTISAKKNLCSDPNTRRFFEIGGAMNFSTYLSSGERFSNSTITSC